MKVLLAISFLITLNASAEDNPCSKKGIELNGQYGKNNSPLLTTWSEASGNLTKLQINSKEKFSKLELVFTNDQKENLKTIALPLKNNRTEHFDFMKSFNNFKVFPHQLIVQVKKSNGTIECSDLVTLIEKDVPDGVLKKP